MTQADVRKYLLPRLNDFWRWHDRGEVAAWNDGSTIAFRAELVTILQRLAPAGLPPLDAVLLVLAACRWGEKAFRDGRLATLFVAFPQYQPLLNDLFAGLDRIRQLPDELRTSAVAREELVALVFENVPAQSSPALAPQIVKQLQAGLPEHWLAAWGPNAEETHLPALAKLTKQLAQVDAERLRMRMRTGMDAVPAPPEFEISPVEALRAMLQTHTGDEEIGGVVRLTKRVLAALSLPRPLADNHDLPMGGVSDITNRGPLDRLLISELAHDDLTLAVRVAVNEALYLRRETPPRARPRARSILIDQGIRTWGLPRVYATAIAMALAAAGDVRGELRVLRTGAKLEAVNLSARAELLRHLEHLAIDRHPGQYVADFHARAKAMEAGDHVLITTADTLADAEFLPFLQQFSDLPLFVVSIERDGSLELLQRSAAGCKTLKRLKLTLDEITRHGEVTPATPLREESPALPAIFRQPIFPLRLPVTMAPERCCNILGLGIVQTMKDGQLMLHDPMSEKRNFGAQQLANDLPGASLLWTKATWTGGFSLVAGLQQQAKLTLYHYDAQQRSLQRFPLDLPREPVLGVWHHGETLFVIYKNQIAPFALATGQPHAVFPTLPGMSWHRQRYFLLAGEWQALAHNGAGCVLQPLSTADSNPLPILDVFECAGHQGPLAVVWPSGLYSFAQLGIMNLQMDGELRKVSPKRVNDRCVQLSPDGWRIVFFHGSRDDHQQLAAFTDRLPAVQAIANDPKAWRSFLEPYTAMYRPLPTLRVYWRQIGISPNGIELQSRRGEWFAIAWNRHSDRLQLQVSNDREAKRHSARAFEPWPGGEAKQLKQATWESGCRAVLDPRGLLHFKGASADLPEFTLVLDEHHISGWAEDGVFFGSSFYAGDCEGMPSVKAFTRYLMPWAQQVSP